jgi:histidinol-phosphate aminotransferase
MPTFRPEIAALKPYEVGRPISEVARSLGIDPSTIVRLASNETPFGPFPGAVEAATAAMAGANRYPDNDLWDLSHALADGLGVDRSNILFGNGSVALLVDAVNAVGGQGTSVVYGWPSFVMYRFAAIWAGSDHVEVPLDEDHVFDLDGIADAVDQNTRIVFVCNPNNPTGTIVSHEAVVSFIDSIPETVLVVIDEAYHEFVEEPRYQTAIPLALSKPNVLVLRTFSKIYGLAAQRIGYAVGDDSLIRELRKAQQPLTVNSVAQAAAEASLGQPEELQRRVAANSAGRHHLMGALEERGLNHAESHTNFVYFEMPSDDSRSLADEFTARGVIIRPMARGWLRVTVGTEKENRRFVEVLDEVVDMLSDQISS